MILDGLQGVIEGDNIIDNGLSGIPSDGSNSEETNHFNGLPIPSM